LDLKKIVAQLERERDRLNQAIDLLKEHNFPASIYEIKRLDGSNLPFSAIETFSVYDSARMLKIRACTADFAAGGSE
jgi:hypothetical protein